MKPERKLSTKKRRSKPCLHLICTAHLDPVWQWRWEEGCAETLSTFRTAVQLLEEHGRFIFNHNEALLYHWIQTYDPPLFCRIQRLVEAGRWSISGGWYLQPDVNLPATESLIRHIAEGWLFFWRYFGVAPRVAYNFDSFGHSGGLPQILVRSGFCMYIHMRPQEPELHLPSDLYRWRGVDGTVIPAYRIAVGLYHTEYDNIQERLDEGVKLALRLNRDVPVFWGIGNHGGGATRKDLAQIESFIKQEPRVRIFHSTPDLFYESVKPLLPNVPLYEGGLQRVFTGCYTSLSRLKRQAVKSQHGLVQTETLRAFTWWSRKQEYPGQELQKAWQDHLFNDFHDILTGTCIEPAEKDALGRYGRVAETAKALRLGAAICLNQGQSLNKGIPVTVLNTIPGMGAVPVEVECMISHRPKWTGFWHMNLFDAKNRAITCQEEQPEALLPFNGWRRKVVFMSELPSVGVTHYHLETKEGPAEQKTARPALDISFGKRSGLIERLGCSETRQLLSGPLLQPLVIDDSADSWGTGVHSYRNVSGEMRLIPESFRTVAEGPIRTIFESRLGFGNSRLTLQTFVYSQWPVLEFRLRLLWAEEQKRLKLSIPTKIKADSVVCEVPGGNIRRPGDGKEHVHGRWLVLDGRPQKMNAALGVINSGLHGFDFKDGEIRLSILRSAAYCHEKGFNLTSYPARKLMDLGLHEFRLLLTVGKPEDVFRRAAVLADWLNTPPFVCAHLPAGTADSLRSRIYPSQSISDLLTIKPENIRLLACKKSWEGDALIIRLQECCGLPARAEVTLHAPKRHLEMSFIPLEIKTLRINKNGQWDEVGLVDEA